MLQHLRDECSALLGGHVDSGPQVSIVDHQEPVALRQIGGYGLAQRVLREAVEHTLAGLQHQLEELGLVELHLVGQEHIAVDLVVALVQFVEVERGFRAARFHVGQYRLTGGLFRSARRRIPTEMEAREAMGRPDVVVVGAAARDVAHDDERGWRLGGGVTYGGLALARLGIRTGVVIGLDPLARGASEIELLRSVGAEVVCVPLERGPVFRNEERPTGRVQTCLSVSDPIPLDAVPGEWSSAPAWLMAPVAAELPERWATVPPVGSCVALGWQGLLRHLYPGERVWPLDPGPSALLRRADLVGASRFDLPHALDLRAISAWLGPRCDLLLTAGGLGGLLLRFREGRLGNGRRYPGVPIEREVDATGAGDTMLAGLLAGRLAGGEAAEAVGHDLYVGALGAARLVERAGLESAPWLRARPENPGQG